MSTTMHAELSPEVVNTLQDLIQSNLDSRDGFQMAAGAVDDMNLASVFEFFAQQRAMQANDLSKFVSRNGERPRREGSYLAIIHRAWAEVRRLLATDDRLAVLEEAVRGEAAILSAYRDAMQAAFGTPAYEMVREQCLHVKAGHDRVVDLCDEYRCDGDA